MIRTNAEYAQAFEQLSGFHARLEEKVNGLKDIGLTEEQIAKVTEPEVAFYDQISDEVESYDRLRRGDEAELERYSEFSDLGKLLIALRIFRGMSQSDLAKGLDVDPSQVSRDERNEYHGVTLQRVFRLLDILGFRLANKPTRLRQDSREFERV
jgi:ribosome-binding protein aMBF1 (putative translation factor)